ncbi:MAG TPA: hypothetical protein VGO47_12335 [Chlamydiales bacterium]|nr:hypothetical protein [Chlamydiales bacterium]
MLKKFNMIDCNPISTPLAKNTQLEPSQQELDTRIPYATAIGGLMYAALGTCPDIAFAVQHLSKFTHAYSEEHWSMSRDIRTTKDYFIYLSYLSYSTGLYYNRSLFLFIHFHPFFLVFLFSLL